MTGSYRVHVIGGGGTTGEYTLNSSVAVAPPPPQVASVVIDDGSAQRSEVRSIAVTFSGPVTFAGGDANAAAAFVLTHVPDSVTVNNIAAAVSTNGSGQTVVTLTFTTTGNSAAAIDPVSGRTAAWHRSPTADSR